MYIVIEKFSLQITKGNYPQYLPVLLLHVLYSYLIIIKKEVRDEVFHLFITYESKISVNLTMHKTTLLKA